MQVMICNSYPSHGAEAPVGQTPYLLLPPTGLAAERLGQISIIKKREHTHKHFYYYRHDAQMQT